MEEEDWPYLKGEGNRVSLRTEAGFFRLNDLMCGNRQQSIPVYLSILKELNFNKYF